MTRDSDETFGISHGGRAAEVEFMTMTGAVKPLYASEGDVLLEEHPVEIKRAKTNTLNQVRAVKYIPVVALDVRIHKWYVIPAHIVVAEVARKTRGQHTEIPFESATLNLSSFSRYIVDDPSELRNATLNAIERSADYPQLKREMERVRTEAREVADQSLLRVRQVLADSGLLP